MRKKKRAKSSHRSFLSDALTNEQHLIGIYTEDYIILRVSYIFLRGGGNDIFSNPGKTQIWSLLLTSNTRDKHWYCRNQINTTPVT